MEWENECLDHPACIGTYLYNRYGRFCLGVSSLSQTPLAVKGHLYFESKIVTLVYFKPCSAKCNTALTRLTVTESCYRMLVTEEKRCIPNLVDLHVLVLSPSSYFARSPSYSSSTHPLALSTSLPALPPLSSPAQARPTPPSAEARCSDTLHTICPSPQIRPRAQQGVRGQHPVARTTHPPRKHLHHPEPADRLPHPRLPRPRMVHLPRRLLPRHWPARLRRPLRSRE